MSDWNQLLAVQAHDTALTQLDHRRAQLPERAELEQVQEQLAALGADVASAEADKHALVKEQKRLEDEIALIEDKITRADEQLYAGGSDIKHLQALQDEIESFRRRITVLEDKELEFMEQVEPIDAALADLGTRREALDIAAIDLTKRLAEAEGEIDVERRAVLAEREQSAAGVAPDALAEYEKVRDRLGGVAVARLEGGVCGACHIKLSAVEHDRIQHLPPDEPVRCEDCDRYLVRG